MGYIVLQVPNIPGIYGSPGPKYTWDLMVFQVINIPEINSSAKTLLSNPGLNNITRIHVFKKLQILSSNLETRDRTEYYVILNYYQE